MALTYTPDVYINDFVKRKDISYKKFLISMAEAHSSLTKIRKRTKGQTDRFQSAEMLTKMSNVFPVHVYRHYLKSVLAFLDAKGSREFTDLLLALGLTLTEAQLVHKMCLDGGYKVMFDTSKFKATTSTLAAATVAPTATTTSTLAAATVAPTAARSTAPTVLAPVNLIPPHWACRVTQVGYSKVELARDSDEFRDVMDVLNRTKSKFREIAKIERIENPRLWRQYQVQKEYTAAACPKGHTIERPLFHGTAEANLDSIMAGGFDRIFSGLSAGATFGRGNYFATSFDYSARGRYSKNGDVLLCNVLIGESVQGESQHKALPFKAQFPGVRFESGVNDVRKPTIFVVYGDVAAYPAYLVKLGRYTRVDDDL